MGSRKETERTKFIQDKCLNLLTQMLRDEDNKYCVDCDAKGLFLYYLIHIIHIILPSVPSTYYLHLFYLRFCEEKV